MKVYYNISIQMAGTHEMDDSTMESASRLLGFTKKDVEETETYSVNVMFASNILPTDMRDRVRSLLLASKSIYYVDAMYRFEYAMVPDRFVIWRDGKTQEYTGFITFTEDK